jgi:hypothetical protein
MMRRAGSVPLGVGASRAAGGDRAGFVGEDDRLDAVPEAELG